MCEPCIQVAMPLFSLLTLQRSFLAVFKGVKDVVHTVFHISLLNERQHFLFTQTALRVLAFHLILIKLLSFSYSVYAQFWLCKFILLYSKGA